MENSTLSFAFTGVVPPVCDAEAGDRLHDKLAATTSTSDGSSDTSQRVDTDVPAADSAHVEVFEVNHGLSVKKIRSVMAELCSAVRSALDDERSTAEDSLRRAAEILKEIGEVPPPMQETARGGLAPWQIRKVTRHVETNLDRPIRNEDLARIVRLNPSHFGRAFRNSFGEPPHEYVIRRRVERAQGLMLSTNAPLSAIALDCGMADQAHLSRLFRRTVGETPRAWRRARLEEFGECI